MKQVYFQTNLTQEHVMTNPVIEALCNFRKKIFDFFVFRADSTMDLIDAIAGHVFKESAVKVSLSNLFRREYSTITDVVDNLFRQKANTNPLPNELKENQLEITRLIAEECPNLIKRSFHLFAVDCSSAPRVYARKLDDRGFVHHPTKVPGQKPITVGHQYSTLVYLPEQSEAHWVIPLSNIRVKSEDSGTTIGIKQFVEATTKTCFKDQLSVLVADSAYSHAKCIKEASQQDDLVIVSRVRNNRKFHCSLVKEEDKIKRRGRPRIYGEGWVLSDPKEPDESIVTEHITASGKPYKMKIERWYDRLDRGAAKVSGNDTKEIDDQNIIEPTVFDAIKVTILRPDGQQLYKKPLWLMVTGTRRREIGSEDIARSYFKRYDIEHYFRFAKQRLLLTSFQTPEVRHEENWWWLCMLSYVMLYLSRSLTDYVRYAWEKKQEKKVATIKTPTQAQRGFEGIIQRIGTPACFPKPRGKSSGRVIGTKMPKRKDCPIVKKTEITPKNEDLAAA